MCFEKLENVAPTEIDMEERKTIGQILAQEPSTLGHFGRLGWIQELLALLPPPGHRNFPYTIRHWNQGINFCLMNLRREDGLALWFKAVGEPNLREYALTHELASRYPAFLPRIVTSIPQWNGWISEEVQGRPLDSSQGRKDWVAVVRSLAELQLRSARDVAVLRQSGARDRSPAHLRTLLRPFFSEIACAMRAQTSTAAPVISDRDLDGLERGLEFALIRLEQSALPDALLHLDIGHGNILVWDHGAVFLDWAEVGVGHPFFSLEQLLAGHETRHPETSSERQAYRDLYASFWREYADDCSIQTVKKLAPAVAAFSYGIDIWESGSAWPDRERRWPLMRAIVRRARREIASASEAA